MRTEKVRKCLINLANYEIDANCYNEEASRIWLDLILSKYDVPSIVVWGKKVILGVNIVNVIKNIDEYSLQHYEVRRVQNCEVDVIYVEGASYEEASKYKNV